MNFIIDGEASTFGNHISGPPGIGMNFFITTVEEGHDVIRNNLTRYDKYSNVAQHNKTVVGIGNAHLSQYAISAEVGSIPKARVSYEGFNIRS
mgnify:CR=1 FL=1